MDDCIEKFIHLEKSTVKVDTIQIQKMKFLYNCLENGWVIRKKENSYIFTKAHEGKREVYDENYLLNFIKTNLEN
jgi:hypothetical protein